MRTGAGLFTSEVAQAAARLPHRDFPLPVRRVVVEAIHGAWERLLDGLGARISGCPEKELTALLARHLNRIRAETAHPSGFRGDLFQDVVCGAELATYDGSSLEKEPDITIRLASRLPLPELAEYYALFIECKIVDRSHPINLYGKKGLVRFIEGAYAWAMPSAMMLAYTRENRTVPETLIPHLEKAQRKDRDPYRTRSLPRADTTLSGAAGCDIFVSVHAREWKYQGSSHGPGEISILHLWLAAD